ncbi:MAG: PepSY domain-containing protein [Idiomarina sp.]
MRLLRWLHRWTSLVLVLQVIIWCISGFYFSWQGHQSLAAHDYFQAVSAKAIKQPLQPLVQQQLQKYPQLLSIRARVVGGESQWVLQQPENEIYLQANGEPWQTSAAQARAIAEASYTGSAAVAAIDYLNTAPELVGQQNAVYRVQFADELSTRAYVDATTGDLLDHRNSNWWVSDWMFRLHFMDYSGARDFNNLLMTAAALLAFWFALSGFILLLREMRSGRMWRTRRSRKA